MHFALVGAWTGMDIPIQLKDMKGTFATTEPGTVPWRLQIEEFIVYWILYPQDFLFWGVDIFEIS